MSPSAAAFIGKLEDTNALVDTRPNRTLAETIAHANKQGWKWFYYGECWYHIDPYNGKWKGTVVQKPTESEATEMLTITPDIEAENRQAMAEMVEAEA